MMTSRVRITCVQGIARNVECLDEAGQVLCQLPCTAIERLFGATDHGYTALKLDGRRVEYVEAVNG